MDAKIHAKISLFLRGVHFGESSELNGRVVARQDRAMNDVGSRDAVSNYPNVNVSVQEPALASSLARRPHTPFFLSIISFMSDRNDISSIPTSNRSKRLSTTRSIRSTSSKAYNRQPTWKTSPLKGPALVAASLSMVFAEPELGSPLSSAATTAAAISTPSNSVSSSDRTRLTDDITEAVEEGGRIEGNSIQKDGDMFFIMFVSLVYNFF